MHPLFRSPALTARRAPWLLGIFAVVTIPVALVAAFTWAQTAIIPLEGGGSQRDFAQKIFYLHVPVAMAAYLGFFVGAWNALRYLLSPRAEYDVRSYVGVHVGMVFGTLVLVTGSLWAKAAWGVWWQWGDRQLLVFLVLYLYYGAYFMLRFSLDAGRHREVASAAFTLLGVALVPLSALAVRLADSLIHPIVVDREGFHMTGQMAATFLVSLAGFLALALVMMYAETAAKLGRRAEERETHSPPLRTQEPVGA